MDLPLCWCATFSPPLLSLTLSVLCTLGWLSHPLCFLWPCQYYVPLGDSLSPPLLSLALSVLRTLGWLSHPPLIHWPCQYYVPSGDSLLSPPAVLGPVSIRYPWVTFSPPLIFFNPVSITYPRATPPACMNLSDTGEPGLICRCEHFPEFPTKLFKPFKKFVSMLNNHLLLNSLILGINKLSVRECKNHFLNIHQFEYIELSK